MGSAGESNILKIVWLERKNVGTDFEMPDLEKFGELVAYEYCSPGEVAERIADADICIMNKMPMNEGTLRDARKLKLICVTATGMDNVDLEYCKSRGIVVKNVSGYSTETVVQHTFAMLFYLYEKMPRYDTYVRDGSYRENPTFCFFGYPFSELAGKTWGIVGLGTIGHRVAQVAKAFGCDIIYYSTTGVEREEPYERVDFDDLLKRSDIISVHAPLNKTTEGMFHRGAFERMKHDAYFLNLGRGPIVNEADLVWALENNRLAGAGLDVLSKEPIGYENPLYGILENEKLLITPHIGWASKEARKRLMEGVYANVEEIVKQAGRAEETN